MRGRVISLYVLVYTAALPLGSLLVGAASERLGVQATVLAEGVLCLLIAVLYLQDYRKGKLAPTTPAVALAS
jgi:predicted MFS family arabinose efflux permease